MKELTKEDILNFPETTYGRALGKTIASKVMNELLQYKQLEEELGCSLNIIRQLFGQDWIYFKYLSNVKVMKVNVIKGLKYGSNPGWYFTCVYYGEDCADFIHISLRDYKKTWWLKEDRSE